MMMHAKAIGFLVVSATLVGCSLAEEDRIDYPPRTKLLEQVIAARAPEVGSARSALVPGKVERGYESVAFQIESGDPAKGPRWVIYDTGQRKITPLDDGPNGAGGQETKPGALAKTIEAVCPGVPPNRFDQWGSKGWLNPKEFADLLAKGNMQEGIACFAKEADKPGEPARLFCHRPPAGPPVDLGPLAKFEGQDLPKVYQLRLMPDSAKIAVLAGNDQVTVLQLYEAPIIETITAQKLAAVARSCGDEPRCKFRTVESLYKHAEQADRGFDSMLLASDGKVYFATMPHHPTKGTPVFRYDPASDKVEVLGGFDDIAANKGPGLVPSMMHTEPFEMNGKVYFTGQSPFYGSYRFPGMTKENTRYAGSPIIAYDLKAGTFACLGTPVERLSLFRFTGDPKRNALYMRTGYESGAWYSWKVGADGKPEGGLKEMAIEQNAGGVHVGSDGKLYYPVVKGAAAESAPANPGGPRPPCEIRRYDPDSGKGETVASFDVEKLHGAELPLDPKAKAAIGNSSDWLAGQEGREEIVGLVHNVGLLFRFHTKTGELKKVGLWFPDKKAYPIRISAAAKVHGDKVWMIWTKSGAFQTGRLLEADLATGKVADHGVLVDQKGRTLWQATQMAVLPNGRIVFGGWVYGHPSDPFTCGRPCNSGPCKVDSGLFVVEKLP